MRLPWWGWLLMVLWCAAGAWVFIRGIVLPYQSLGAFWYYFVDDRGFRLIRFVLRLIPMVMTFAILLFLGPVLLALELPGRRERRRREQRREEGRQRRAARKLARQQRAADS